MTRKGELSTCATAGVARAAHLVPVGAPREGPGPGHHVLAGVEVDMVKAVVLEGMVEKEEHLCKHPSSSSVMPNTEHLSA